MLMGVLGKINLRLLEKERRGCSGGGNPLVQSPLVRPDGGVSERGVLNAVLG